MGFEKSLLWKFCGETFHFIGFPQLVYWDGLFGWLFIVEQLSFQLLFLYFILLMRVEIRFEELILMIYLGVAFKSPAKKTDICAILEISATTDMLANVKRNRWEAISNGAYSRSCSFNLLLWRYIIYHPCQGGSRT